MAILSPIRYCKCGSIMPHLMGDIIDKHRVILYLHIILQKVCQRNNLTFPFAADDVIFRFAFLGAYPKSSDG